VWLVDMGMVGKVRPALILSGSPGVKDRDVITVIPHTTSLRSSAFEISVPLPFLKPGAFLAQTPATLPTVRALKLLGRMGESDVRRIEQALLTWLEIAQ
jgi:mRNA interferase MazF